MKKNIIITTVFSLLSLSTWASDKKEIWIYTSIYKEFAEPLAKAFETKHPDIHVQIFQAGSEKIQAKLEAELLAQKPQADVLMTSDPFWSTGLEKRGLLALRPSRPSHSALETNYYSLMVLICHRSFPQSQRPSSFIDLTKPEYNNLIQTGSPLESGTTFTTVAYLSKKYGWEYFKKLRDNHLSSNGGNSTVIQKVESGEKKVGIVLLENALAAKKRGSPIDIIYPSDGSIPIPSVQVILKGSRQSEAATRFADFVLSSEGQALLRNGFMYSVRKDIGPPEGAKPLSEVTRKSTPWTPELISEVAANSKDIKKKFSELILE